MKNNFKFACVFVLVAFCTIFINSEVSATTVIQPVQSGNLSLSLSEVEEIIGYKSDKSIQVNTSSKTYKIGDSIKVKWDYAKSSSRELHVGIINEEYEDTIEYVTVPINQKSHTFVVTEEMPSGKYFVMVVDEISIDDTNLTASFGVSKEFSIKTKNTKDTYYESKISTSVVKANFANSRASAELFYDTNGNYKNVCKTSGSWGIKDSLSSVSKALGQKVDCDSSATSWAAEVKLKSSKSYYCVDSTGFLGEQKNLKVQNQLVAKNKRKLK